MSQLRIRGLNKSYGTHKVLTNIDLDISAGEFVVFVGPSGCGKSTLLRCIAGLETFSSGLIEIGGSDAHKLPVDKRGVAMVFQSYALYPHMSVFDNIAFSLKLQKWPIEKIETKVRAAAGKLRLDAYLDRLPGQLSGGQRQRVAIGRAIVRDPKIFLFDEPLSNLDAELRVQMRMEIAQLKTELPDTTMIYVTHDQVEAMTLADRIVVLNDGRIEDIGTPKMLFEQPRNRFIAGFIGSPKMNFLTGETAAALGATTVGIRPDGLRIGTATATGWPGRVAYCEYLGADSYVYVDIGENDPVVVRLGDVELPAVGAEVRVVVDESALHRFSDSDG